MPTIEYIALIVLGIYSLTIFMLFMGWKKLKSFNHTIIKNPIQVSIVIACRNEEENIINLLDSLSKQIYPKEKTEIILVDDHSEDDTINIVGNFIQMFEHMKFLKLPNNKKGKKDAINYGINSAKSDIIITTDADCSMNNNWLASLVAYYLKFRPKILSAPVCFKDEKRIFQKFQSLEYLSLVGTGAGAIGINRPIMNNGANLLFEKTVFTESNLQNNYASGDDIFLMLSTKKKYKNSIHFLKSKDAIISTNAIKKIKEFFNQRIRWTSKSKAYRDFDIIFVALIVALTNLLLSFFLIYSLFNYSAFKAFLILFLLKSVFDLLILILVSAFFNKEKLIWLFFPLQIIYPFYIVITVLFGLLGNFKWKDRTFKEKG